MKTIGFAMCGSFCTFEKAVGQMEALSHSYAILPLMSQNAYTTDTRFGKAQDWVRRVEGIAGRPVLHTIVLAEPIGPKAWWICWPWPPAPGTPSPRLPRASPIPR